MESLGYVGLGTMGGGMVKNLLAAGYPVIAYDRDAEAMKRAVDRGAQAANGTPEIVEKCRIIHLCLVGEVALEIIEKEILPVVKPGQVIIDHSTMGPPDNRRNAAKFAEKKANYLDVPISGGGGGADAGVLRMFVGGDRATYDEIRPILEAMADPQKIIYGGPSGKGQAIKIMQQLEGRLLNLARLEIIAWGRRQGFDNDMIMAIHQNRDDFRRVLEGVESGHVDTLSCLYPEWKYYLAEAHQAGIPQPMLEGAMAYYSRGEKDFADVVNRPSPNLWNELMKDYRPDSSD